VAEDAVAEAWRALGRQLAASRRAATLTQEQLAPLSGYSRSTIANTETGRQRVPRSFWENCDAVLGTGTALGRGHDEVTAAERGDHLRSAVVARQVRVLVGRDARHDVASPPQLVPGAEPDSPAALNQIESLRQWLDDALTDGPVGGASVETWEQTALLHGRVARMRPAAEHVIELGADMAELGVAIQRCRSASSLRGLVRVTAHLSGLMCLLFVKLDERESFRKWASTARTAAAEAGDPGTLSWVLAQEAYGHFYSGDLVNAVRVAQQAQSLTRRTPLVGAALAAALEARAEAARGRVQETRSALARAEAILAALGPASVTASAFGYTESQLRFHEGNAYTRLGDTRRALQAQERALELCPPGDYTDWALTRLDRAYCLSRDGDAPAGVAYAAETLAQLRTVHSQGIIALRAHELVRALPVGYQASPNVREFENLLMPATEPVREIQGP
jgi:tetratricopeptide (TPR) repeat protein